MASWVKYRRYFWKLSKAERLEMLKLATARYAREDPESFKRLYADMEDFVRSQTSRSIDINEPRYSIPFNISGEAHENWARAVENWQDRPPAACEFITAALSSPKFRAKIVGDRAEIYKSDLDRWGETRADWLYRIDTIKSAGPLAMQLSRGAGLFQILRDWIGRLLS